MQILDSNFEALHAGRKIVSIFEHLIFFFGFYQLTTFMPGKVICQAYRIFVKKKTKKVRLYCTLTILRPAQIKL